LAHRDGKAEPRIAARATGKGLDRTFLVRLTDLDSGRPVSGATVEVETTMTRPHFMSLIPRKVPEASPPGTYRLPYHFIMAGDWTAEFRVSGAKVIGAKAKLPVPIAESPRPATPQQPFTTLPTRLETDVTGRDWTSMAVLFLHSIASLTWILGVIVMGIALATPPLLAGGVRARVAAAYRSWGAWLHWAAVPVIIGTGIYNMVYVTPFELRWPWDPELDAIAYGNVYEAILFVKLALFVVLLATGTWMLVRAVAPQRAPAPAVAHGSAEPTHGLVRTLANALGPAGIVYVLTVPLILAAAMALRYVHILSHVGEVVNQ
jgi:YtkA-like